MPFFKEDLIICRPDLTSTTACDNNRHPGALTYNLEGFHSFINSIINIRSKKIYL